MTPPIARQVALGAGRGALSTRNASSRVAHPLVLWLRQGVCWALTGAPLQSQDLSQVLLQTLKGVPAPASRAVQCPCGALALCLGSPWWASLGGSLLPLAPIMAANRVGSGSPNTLPSWPLLSCWCRATTPTRGWGYCWPSPKCDLSLGFRDRLGQGWEIQEGAQALGGDSRKADLLSYSAGWPIGAKARQACARGDQSGLHWDWAGSCRSQTVPAGEESVPAWA